LTAWNQLTPSLKRRFLRSTDSETRKQILSTLTTKEKTILLNSFELRARDKQLEPIEPYYVWLLLAGRGFGKTFAGAGNLIANVEAKKAGHIGLIAPTTADARDLMVETILKESPDGFRPTYLPSKRLLRWDQTGATAHTFSSEEPESLRGYEWDYVWGEELCKWKYVDYTWDMMKFALRSGKSPKVCVTTTPKPLKLIKDLVSDPNTIVTTGSTFENTALPDAFIQHIKDKYDGSRLGRQELYAEILLDNQNALWKRQDIDENRVIKAPDLKRIVVAIDPATTNNSNSDETGIIVAGIDHNDHAYVLDDLSLKASPKQWAERAISAYHKYQADKIVVEKNQGGDMVEHVLKTVDPNIPIKMVHASRGKYVRAEPVATKYEQARVSHVGHFPELEDELTQWEPASTKSPNHLDALVWALTELMLGGFEVLIGRA